MRFRHEKVELSPDPTKHIRTRAQAKFHSSFQPLTALLNPLNQFNWFNQFRTREAVSLPLERIWLNFYFFFVTCALFDGSRRRAGAPSLAVAFLRLAKCLSCKGKVNRPWRWNTSYQREKKENSGLSDILVLTCSKAPQTRKHVESPKEKYAVHLRGYFRADVRPPRSSFF